MDVMTFFTYLKTLTLFMLLFIDVMFIIFIASGVLMFISEVFSPTSKDFTFEQYLVNFKMICFYVTSCFIVLNLVLYLFSLA